MYVVLSSLTKKYTTMFTIINDLPDDILGIVVSGKVTKEDYDRINPVLEQHEQKYNEIKLFVDYQEFKWPTVNAMWEDLKVGFNYWGAIKAVAIVSKKEWLEDSADVMGTIMPGIKGEGFEPNERDKAISWLQEA